jgi:DNA repair photolyase
MQMTQFLEIQCKTALNRVSGMRFKWSLNPYQGCHHGCVYCFARAHAKRADRDYEEGFSTQIRVKINVVEVLRRELSSRSWKNDLVAFGTATDPYQPIEGKYRLTRGCLEAFRDFKTPVDLITKGTLIVRDVELLTELSKRAETTVIFSVPSVDEDVWRKTEPGTPPPRQRLSALRKLVQVGVKAGVGMAPILPGISDSPKQLEATVRAAAEAGACFLWCNVVYLKPGTREYFFQFMQKEFPHLAKHYEALFPKPYAPHGVKEKLEETISTFRNQYKIWDRRKVKLEPPPTPTQLPLFL